jgi:hypothetical protein
MMRGVALRDGLLVLGLLGLMCLIVLLSARQDAGDDVLPALSSYSTQPNGTQALALWLEALGHPVRRVEGVSFRLDPDARLLLVLAPRQTFSSGEVERVDDWVKAGGTLVLSVDSWRAGPLLEHFEVDVAELDDRVERAGPAQPLLRDPPWTQAVVRAGRYLVTARDDVVVHVAAEGGALLLAFDHGAGRVFVATTTFPFTNAGLREADNARLVHNLVAAAGRGAEVVFDEFHHGYQTAHTLGTWLRVTPQGHSLIYVALVVFVYLLAGGRHFGRPLPGPRAASRRAPVEHIQAMANLFWRGGKRAAILHHYHDRLKRELGGPYRLDPTLPGDEFVSRLVALRPDLDRSALTRLLQATSQDRVSEGELLRLAREVDEWI